jgi:hypothetical protein
LIRASTWRPDVAKPGGPSTPFQLDGHLPVKPPILRTQLWRCAEGHLGFYGFLCLANARLLRRGTFDELGLTDQPWRASYDAGAHPIDEADKTRDGIQRTPANTS